MEPPSPAPEPVPPWSPTTEMRVFLVACAGGLLGTLGAVLEEGLSVVPLAFVVVGPVIEEVMKPIGMIILLEKRPRWIRGAAQVVIYSVLGAVIFATIENLVYIFVFHPRGGPSFVAFRFTACTALHVVCTTIFALGLVKVWRRVRTGAGSFDLDDGLGYVIAAVAVHGLYNLTVTILEKLEVLKFAD